jgi:hypothetical protein
MGYRHLFSNRKRSCTLFTILGIGRIVRITFGALLSPYSLPLGVKRITIKTKTVKLLRNYGSDVKPQIDLLSALRKGLMVRAKFDISAETRLISTENGTTLWTGSAYKQGTVGMANLLSPDKVRRWELNKNEPDSM